ncbi:MAG: hypothetical protein K0S74_203 [Chlamydiales bacterium]|jgi:hypothetical protein|nr:hypothetical protein [Chlamydiales bacterium]
MIPPILENIKKEIADFKPNKVVSMQELQDIEFQFEDIAKEQHARMEEMNDFNRSFMIYISAIELLYITANFLLDSTELKKHAKKLNKIEDLYNPSGPPLSPIFESYYNMWLLFDYKIEGYSLADMILALKDMFSYPLEVIELIKLANTSYAGIYKYIGKGPNDILLLEDIVTKKVYEVKDPNELKGIKKGELWYIRLLPPLPEYQCAYYTSATTPYILTGHKEQEWLDYFKRQSIIPNTLGVEHRLAEHMHYGKSTTYWLEYIVQSYVKQKGNVIILKGLPDCEETRPYANGPLTKTRKTPVTLEGDLQVDFGNLLNKFLSLNPFKN